jgi:hypothetical protein
MELAKMFFIPHDQLGAVLQRPFDDMMFAPSKRERRKKLNSFVSTLTFLKVLPKKGAVIFIGSGLNGAGEPGVIIALEGSVADVIAESTEPSALVEFQEDSGTFYDLEHFRGSVFNGIFFPGEDGTGYYGYIENGKRFYDRTHPVSLPLVPSGHSHRTHVAWFNK